jgi:hypothetical protein
VASSGSADGGAASLQSGLWGDGERSGADAIIRSTTIIGRFKNLRERCVFVSHAASVMATLSFLGSDREYTGDFFCGGGKLTNSFPF